MSIDDIDRQILAVLADDGRASFAKIGAMVGLSSPAVKRRFDRLTDTGIITGFSATIASDHLGWNVEAYVEVHCQGQVSPGEIRQALVPVPEVLSAATVSGQADALVHVVAGDMGHVEDALERIRRATRADHTNTAIVLTRLIDRRPVPGDGALR